jgi:hypothetical protein
MIEDGCLMWCMQDSGDGTSHQLQVQDLIKEVCRTIDGERSSPPSSHTFACTLSYLADNRRLCSIARAWTSLLSPLPMNSLLLVQEALLPVAQPQYASRNHWCAVVTCLCAILQVA